LLFNTFTSTDYVKYLNALAGDHLRSTNDRIREMSKILPVLNSEAQRPNQAFG